MFANPMVSSLNCGARFYLASLHLNSRFDVFNRSAARKVLRANSSVRDAPSVHKGRPDNEDRLANFGVYLVYSSIMVSGAVNTITVAYDRCTRPLDRALLHVAIRRPAKPFAPAGRSWSTSSARARVISWPRISSGSTVVMNSGTSCTVIFSGAGKFNLCFPEGVCAALA